MGFIEFLNESKVLAIYIIILFVLGSITYLIRLYFKSKPKTLPHEVVEIPSEKDLISTLKGLEEKPKKVEVIHRVEKKIKKVKKPEDKPKVISEEDTPSKPYQPLKAKSKMDYFSYRFWKGKVLDKYFADSITLVNMELMNGFHRTFVVKESDEGFTFRGKKFLFDDQYKYYNIDARLYAYDFHEGLTMAIKRKVPLTNIKKSIENLDIDVKYAINPATLQRFITAKIAEGVMKGTQLDEFLRKLNMFIIVILVAVLVHLALFLYASGILQQVKLPF